MPKHNRILGLIGTSLTIARTNRHDVQALAMVRDRLEPVLETDGFLRGAPFTWVTVAVRYGLVDAAIPTYFPINKKYGDLPLAIEVDTHRITGLNLLALTNLFQTAVLIALIHAGKKYDRPTTTLESIHMEMKN